VTRSGTLCPQHRQPLHPPHPSLPSTPHPPCRRRPLRWPRRRSSSSCPPARRAHSRPSARRLVPRASRPWTLQRCVVRGAGGAAAACSPTALGGQEFNARTAHLEVGLPTPTIVNINPDRTFTFETKSAWPSCVPLLRRPRLTCSRRSTTHGAAAEARCRRHVGLGALGHRGGRHGQPEAPVSDRADQAQGRAGRERGGGECARVRRSGAARDSV
jgi:hypothetical protein